MIESLNGIIITAVIKVSGIDKLRMFFGRPMHYQVSVKTEFDAGKTKIDWQHCYAEHIFPQKPETVMAVGDGNQQ